MADLSQSPIKWEKLPPSDWVVRAHASEIYEGKLYVAGGIDAKGTRNTVNVLDLETGTWSFGPEYPGQGRTKGFGMTLCVWNGRLFANSYSSKVYMLSTRGKGWELAQARLNVRRFFHRMLPAGNRLLFVAGANFEKHLDDVEEFVQPPQPTGRRWPGFRGVGNSIASAQSLPLQWSDTKNIRWRIKLPGYGQSSPVVWDGKIFTTAIEGENCDAGIIYCTSLKNGKELWRMVFDSSSPVKRSRMVSLAAPTPVVDNAGLYVFFESGDLLALSHDGKKLWHRYLGGKYGPLRTHHGLGSSLFQSRGRLGLLLDHPDPSQLLCLDKQNGRTIWAKQREKRVSWSTPVLIDDALLISSNGVLEEIDFATGEQRWYVDGLTGNTVASASVTQNLVIIGSSAKGNCVAVRRGGKGNVGETHIVWKSAKATSSFGSPLAHANHVYFVSRAGILSCVDSGTGQTKWDRRLGASCWASPLAAGERIYFFDKDGSTLVLQSGGSQEALAENKLSVSGVVYGVAAIDQHFIIRTGSELICINHQ